MKGARNAALRRAFRTGGRLHARVHARGQQEGERLAAPRLGDAQQVAAGQRGGQGAALHGRGGLKPLLF